MKLSVLIGVSFCGFPNDFNVFIVGITIRELWKTPPTYASAADATEYHSVLHSTIIAPFLKICHLCVVCLLGDKNL